MLRLKKERNMYSLDDKIAKLIRAYGIDAVRSIVDKRSLLHLADSVDIVDGKIKLNDSTKKKTTQKKTKMKPVVVAETKPTQITTPP